MFVQMNVTQTRDMHVEQAIAEAVKLASPALQEVFNDDALLSL